MQEIDGDDGIDRTLYRHPPVLRCDIEVKNRVDIAGRRFAGPGIDAGPGRRFGIAWLKSQAGEFAGKGGAMLAGAAGDFQDKAGRRQKRPEIREDGAGVSGSARR